MTSEDARPRQENSALSVAAVVFEGPYNETMSLLEEARSFAEQSTAESARSRRLATDSLDLPIHKLRASCEALRVTSRLSSCLAWLLVRKAVGAGELTEIEGCQPEHRLEVTEICLDVDGEADDDLPRELRRLLTQSRKMYERVQRLDHQCATRVLPA